MNYMRKFSFYLLSASVNNRVLRKSARVNSLKFLRSRQFIFSYGARLYRLRATGKFNRRIKESPGVDNMKRSHARKRPWRNNTNIDLISNRVNESETPHTKQVRP